MAHEFYYLAFGFSVVHNLVALVTPDNESICKGLLNGQGLNKRIIQTMFVR